MKKIFMSATVAIFTIVLMLSIGVNFFTSFRKDNG